MDIATRIRKVGFRKWYERQLVDSHLSFTTCVLCGLTVAACLESLSFRDFGAKGAFLLAVVAACIALGAYSWRRYHRVLERAERYGDRSSCPSCHTYARFEVIATGQATEGPYLDPVTTALPYPWLRVRCRKCATEWRLPE